MRIDCSKQNSFLQHKSKLLIIDDDSTFSRALSYRLKQQYQGVKVEIADTGQRGLNFIENNGFSLIILDLRMEGMNGAEVLKKIRQMKKYYKVVILTAYADEKLMSTVREENPEEIFNKGSFKIDCLSPYVC
jgi:DNA-binding NtrC family response regulator